MRTSVLAIGCLILLVLLPAVGRGETTYLHSQDSGLIRDVERVNGTEYILLPNFIDTVRTGNETIDSYIDAHIGVVITDVDGVISLQGVLHELINHTVVEMAYQDGLWYFFVKNRAISEYRLWVTDDLNGAGTFINLSFGNLEKNYGWKFWRHVAVTEEYIYAYVYNMHYLIYNRSSYELIKQVELSVDGNDGGLGGIFSDDSGALYCWYQDRHIQSSYGRSSDDAGMIIQLNASRGTGLFETSIWFDKNKEHFPDIIELILEGSELTIYWGDGLADSRSLSFSTYTSKAGSNLVSVLGIMVLLGMKKYRKQEQCAPLNNQLNITRANTILGCEMTKVLWKRD